MITKSQKQHIRDYLYFKFMGASCAELNSLQNSCWQVFSLLLAPFQSFNLELPLVFTFVKTPFFESVIHMQDKIGENWLLLPQRNVLDCKTSNPGRRAPKTARPGQTGPMQISVAASSTKTMHPFTNNTPTSTLHHSSNFQGKSSHNFYKFCKIYTF